MPQASPANTTLIDRALIRLSGEDVSGFLQGLVTQGQRTFEHLDRVISDLERNPAGYLLGGDNVPEYGARRR